MLFHHLHQHLVSLHVSVSVSALVSTSISISINHINLNPTSKARNLHIGLGVHVTFQDIKCCWKLLRLVHEIIAFTAVEMGMHDHVVPCHPLVWIHSQPAMSERGILYATQIERQRNEHTRLWQWETEGVFVNRMQQRTCALRSGCRSSSHLCGGGGKEGAEEGRGSLTVMVVVGEKAREKRAAMAPDRNNKRHQRGNCV